MVRGNLLRIWAMFCGKLQGLLVGRDGFPQAPLRDQDIRQGKGAGDNKNDVARLPHAVHPVIQGRAGGLQVSAGPVGDFQRDGSLGAPEKVTFGDVLERQFGIFHRGGKIALHLGIVGAGHGDHRWQGLQLGFIRHNRLTTRVIQASLGILQVGFAGLWLAGIHERLGYLGAEHRPDPDHIFWEFLDPAQPGGRLKTIIHTLIRRLSQPRRPPKITGSKSMLKGFGPIPGLFIPQAGAEMIFCNFCG